MFDKINDLLEKRFKGTIKYLCWVEPNWKESCVKVKVLGFKKKVCTKYIASWDTECKSADYDFSIKQIINGVSDIFDAVTGPILKWVDEVIEDIINSVLNPIMK